VDISLRARFPVVGTLAAVLLLALVTGASNHAAPGGDGAAQQLAAGGRPAAGSTLRTTSAPSGSTVTSTTVMAGVPGRLASNPSGPGAPAGGPGSSDGTAGPAVAEGDTGEEGVTATPGAEASSTATPDPETADSAPLDATADAGPIDTGPVDTTPPAPSFTRLHGIEQEVLALTNADRADQGVAAVSRDGCLDAEASAWARQMADAGMMTHSPDGGPSVQGCRGANAYWGDNIGHWQPCLAASMEEWWMGSPSHRPHILDPVYGVVGIGVWSDPSGRCWFQVFFGS
jgi:uncharacterized protein YkwD